MNELTLSNDLKTIELEINHHKNIAGQSIWEIGRRLNHVKQNDLVHGQFMDWLQKVKIEHTSAKRMMKIADEIPNSATLHHLGESALYLISSLPDEEKKEQLERVEQGESPTTRELQQLKRELRQKDKEMEMLTISYNEQNELLEEARQQKPKVVTEKVEVEVIPDDYEQLKKENEALSNTLDSYKDSYDALLKERKNQDEDSKKYKELSEAIQNMEGKMNRTQKLIQTQKQVYELVDLSKDLLIKITPIPYLIDAEYVSENYVAKRELENIANQTQRFLNNLNDVLDKSNILEGEIINE